MKSRIIILATLFLSVLWLPSCMDESLVQLNDNVASNELKEPSKTEYVLTKETEADEFEKFQWTAPDYGFSASITYTLQVDKGDGDFSLPQDIATISKSLDASIKVSEMNLKLLALGLTPDEAATIKFRVVSTINDNVNPVISNIRTVTVTPYATSFPSIYGMGKALKGWGPWPDNAVEIQSSEFKKYETVAYFTSGEAFRFFAQMDWGPTSYNFPFFTTIDPLFENANDDDSNLKFIGTTGWYKINVDLKNQSVTMLSVPEPVLYMMGSAINGWGPWNDKEVKMTYLKPGVFSVESTFSSGAFRFFAQADWGPLSYNYPYFTSVASDFENANDGDSNLQFVGTPGSRKITVDLNAKTVVIGDIPKPKLYMTGAALNGWSWDAGIPVELTYVSPGVYTATATFTSGEAFRFFAQADWSPTSYNYPYFTTVDTNFVNANDGDSNLKYVGTTGSVTIHVDLNAKVVSVP
jgi:starch-binding outer membrane protein SusE/F